MNFNVSYEVKSAIAILDGLTGEKKKKNLLTRLFAHYFYKEPAGYAFQQN